jgi:hypothetical protein
MKKKMIGFLCSFLLVFAVTTEAVQIDSLKWLGYMKECMPATEEEKEDFRKDFFKGYHEGYAFMENAIKIEHGLEGLEEKFLQIYVEGWIRSGNHSGSDKFEFMKRYAIGRLTLNDDDVSARGYAEGCLYIGDVEKKQ